MTRRVSTGRRGGLLPALALALIGPAAASAQDSATVRLLKGGRVPEERQGVVLEMIGKRGSAADLGYVYARARESAGFAPAVRTRALEALVAAARDRRLRPEGDLSGVAALAADPSLDGAGREAAVRLAGLWKLEAAADALRDQAAAADAAPALRRAAVEALAAIGGDRGRAALDALAGADHSWPVRAAAVGALAALDLDAAARQAAGLLASAPDAAALPPLLAPILDRRGGPEALAAAVSAAPPSADAAKLALRSLYALGRSDAALVEALGRAAGLDAEAAPPSPEALAALVADVAAQGDPARGEQVFRRVDLNCLGCHAIAGAGGAVGPDLGSIGASSPPDYLLRSILTPDESIKEQYHTLVVQTADGRVLQGIVADRDDQRLVLREATGATRTVPAAEVEDEAAGGSLMPRGLAGLMTRAELVDLARFLSELGKPGPYALPASSSVRRWRALRDVEALDAGADPSDATVRGLILSAPEERWAPAFAAVAGRLPLDEAAATAGGPLVFLRADLDVTAAGPVRLALDDPAGVRLWVDGAPLALEGANATADLPTGRHAVLVRVATAARPAAGLALTVAPAQGSPARVAPVGGP